MYIDDDDIEFAFAFGHYSKRTERLYEKSIFVPGWLLITIYLDLNPKECYD